MRPLQRAGEALHRWSRYHPIRRGVATPLHAMRPITPKIPTEADVDNLLSIIQVSHDSLTHPQLPQVRDMSTTFFMCGEISRRTLGASSPSPSSARFYWHISRRT